MRSIIFISFIFLLLVSISASGCKITRGYVGTNVGNHISATYQLFNGTKTKSIRVDAGKTMVIDYSSEVKKGNLEIKLLDVKKELFAGLETNITGTKTITAVDSEKYELVITGADTEGSFDVSWETQ